MADISVTGPGWVTLQPYNASTLAADTVDSCLCGLNADGSPPSVIQCFCDISAQHDPPYNVDLTYSAYHEVSGGLQGPYPSNTFYQNLSETRTHFQQYDPHLYSQWHATNFDTSAVSLSMVIAAHADSSG